jgi:hypothetical protein
MTCTPPSQQPDNLDEAADRAICWANHSLSLHGRPMLDAIWWLSTHLVASDRVLHRTLRRQPEYRQAVGDQRRRAREIHSALWALERSLTGDGRMVRRSAEGLADGLRDAVRSYVEHELVLLQAVARYSDDATQQRLAVDYARAVRRAPTRPHPLLHRSLFLRSAFLRLEGIVDHSRDVMDSRDIPMTSRRIAKVATHGTNT